MFSKSGSSRLWNLVPGRLGRAIACACVLALCLTAVPQIGGFRFIGAAEAGIASKAAKTFIAKKLVTRMFLNSSKVVRSQAKKQFFKILKDKPDLAPQALRLVQDFAKSPKAIQALKRLDRQDFIKNEVEPIATRLKVWNRPHIASDSRLNRFLGELYRKSPQESAFGNGSAADALRHELATGNPVAGKFHATKVQGAIAHLDKWLKANPGAPPADRSVVKLLIDDMTNALMGRGM